MPDLSLDHAVIGVKDLELAAQSLGQLLGREPSWRGRHPDYGTANILFRLENSYIELLALDPGATRTTPWTAGLDRFLADQGEGMYAVALQTPDVAASASALQERGLAIEDPAAGEGVDLQSGAVRHWANARVSAAATGGARCFVIEHRSPPDALPLAPLTVPEAAAALRLTGVVLESEDIAAARSLCRDVLALPEQALADAWRYELGNASLVLKGGKGSPDGLPHRWSLIVLEAADLEAVRGRLGFDYEEAAFLGAPGLLLFCCGAGIFLRQPS